MDIRVIVLLFLADWKPILETSESGMFFYEEFVKLLSSNVPDTGIQSFFDSVVDVFIVLACACYEQSVGSMSESQREKWMETEEENIWKKFSKMKK